MMRSDRGRHKLSKREQEMLDARDDAEEERKPEIEDDYERYVFNTRLGGNRGWKEEKPKGRPWNVASNPLIWRKR